MLFTFNYELKNYLDLFSSLSKSQGKKQVKIICNMNVMPILIQKVMRGKK